MVVLISVVEQNDTKFAPVFGVNDCSANVNHSLTAKARSFLMAYAPWDGNGEPSFDKHFPFWGGTAIMGSGYVVASSTAWSPGVHSGVLDQPSDLQGKSRAAWWELELLDGDADALAALNTNGVPSDFSARLAYHSLSTSK
jgi:hypothetical protein